MVEGELNPHADWINLMADIKHANKDKDNAFFKSRYATLENVLDRINEVSKPHRFSFYHNHLYDAETNTQYLVLINTYLRRIMLSTLFGIGADEDLDGNDSSQVNNNNDGVTKEKKPSSSNYPKKELNPQPSSAPQPPSPGKPNFRDKL